MCNVPHSGSNARLLYSKPKNKSMNRCALIHSQLSRYQLSALPHLTIGIMLAHESRRAFAVGATPQGIFILICQSLRAWAALNLCPIDWLARLWSGIVVVNDQISHRRLIIASPPIFGMLCLLVYPVWARPYDYKQANRHRCLVGKHGFP